MVAQHQRGHDRIDVFDIDGGGLISVVVLERSLMQFDGDVFTEDTLSELLGAVPHGPGPHGDEAVSIKAFADLVGSGEPPRRQRPRSAELRARPMHACMDGLEFDVRGFREALALDPTSLSGGALASGADQGGPGSSDQDSEHELSLVKEDLKMRAKEYVLDVQRRSLLPLWEAAACNRAGALALADCEQLVAAYLRELAPRSAELVRATVELGIELSVLLFERRNQDPAARGRVRAQAKLQADALVGRVAPLVREMLETMQEEDPRMLAADLMECLGSDSNGTVTREAFEAHFVEAMKYVLGPERMVERLQCLGSGAPGVRLAEAVEA